MSKALSNGTLSLRFMQNAHRAKQQAEVQLEQAKIKDEAEWEVPKEVKEAWGIDSISAASSSVVHESSYMPFLFEAGDAPEDPQPQSKGRRSFNAKGKEIESKVAPEPVDAPENVAKGAQPASKHPTSISGFKVPEPTSVKKKVKQSTGTRTKTVQELIREDATRRAPATLRDEPVPSPGFVKPSGVDAPPARRSRALPQDGGFTLKRDREGESGDTLGSEGKRRRKKKEPHMIE